MRVAKGCPVKPECHLGYTRAQVVDVFGDRVGEFDHWMRGQTIGLCEGKRYNYETEEYEPACEGVAHGPAWYPWDVQRFIRGDPVID